MLLSCICQVLSHQGPKLLHHNLHALESLINLFPSTEMILSLFGRELLAITHPTQTSVHNSDVMIRKLVYCGQDTKIPHQDSHTQPWSSGIRFIFLFSSTETYILVG